ncbi:phosphatases II [Eremomyces bilateralis CBS 781.70]|uniref:Phosphatases II n=1 Tax=Eremomyces bilateralis CBS 781.70 TaxID=1392243 RepID=A0A6G1G0U3_9PEZI|nr:phosphatases II [Eremomyces bilateralis CBS 781.70]KAF1811638.1 phosphatases II [Eremomyces bilateralis CBS 781.70]
MERYTYTVPHPPPIIVPPLVGPQYNQVNIRPSNFSPSSLRYSSKAINLGMMDMPLTLDFKHAYDWDRSCRWKAQQILPRVYLGPQNVVKDLQYLEKEGITMVLGVVQNQSLPIAESATRLAREVGIEIKCLGVESNATTSHMFGQATALINEHISRLLAQVPSAQHWGKVLVFCESGNEKSAAIVAAYMIEMFLGIDEVSALQLIGKKRFCISVDDTIRHTLQNWSDMQQAQRDVASHNALSAETQLQSGIVKSNTAPQLSLVPPVKPRKRSYSDVENEESMDLDFETESASRQPFQDVPMS